MIRNIYHINYLIFNIIDCTFVCFEAKKIGSCDRSTIGFFARPSYSRHREILRTNISYKI